MANVLVVDDEPKMTALICGALEDAGHKVSTTTSSSQALELIKEHSFDVVITDLSMPEVSGIVVLEKALEKEGTEVIMMTAYGTAQTAVEAMKKGAADYLLKPFPLDELQMLVRRLVSKQRLESLFGHYEQVVRQSIDDTFVGSSDAAKALKALIAKVAPTDTTVLLTGHSGTGKELAARMIHEQSRRREHPFIAVNCAALAETLLESELFGHEKGAFTGAVARKRGRFELADTGTIFLDEIGEMSPGLQSKLLRVLEERRIIRVGGVDVIDVDVRVVAATNRDLGKAIADGRFREDLFYRLNVFPIELPTLAVRGHDVIELADYFLTKAAYPHHQLATDIRELFLSYDWPGNVRELRNVLERAMILAGGEPLTSAEFSLERSDKPLIAEAGSRIGAGSGGLGETERQMILEALERASGNKTEAAKSLRITRRRLYSRMKAHNIDL